MYHVTEAVSAELSSSICSMFFQFINDHFLPHSKEMEKYWLLLYRKLQLICNLQGIFQSVVGLSVGIFGNDSVVDTQTPRIGICVSIICTVL